MHSRMESLHHGGMQLPHPGWGFNMERIKDVRGRQSLVSPSMNASKRHWRRFCMGRTSPITSDPQEHCDSTQPNVQLANASTPSFISSFMNKAPKNRSSAFLPQHSYNLGDSNYGSQKSSASSQEG
jgi:hypothetical protein